MFQIPLLLAQAAPPGLDMSAAFIASITFATALSWYLIKNTLPKMREEAAKDRDTIMKTAIKSNDIQREDFREALSTQREDFQRALEEQLNFFKSELGYAREERLQDREVLQDMVKEINYLAVSVREVFVLEANNISFKRPKTTPHDPPRKVSST